MFQPDLKLADVNTVYKKKSKLLKDTYRSVSVLSNIYLSMKEFVFIKNL